jgi:hypothetical protein
MPTKKMIVAGLVLSCITVCAIATRPPANGYHNLQVLPKDISPKDLNRIMVDEFTDGLGVSCSFCHGEDKATHRPDYANDAKPEKEMARIMIRMTRDLNKKYFKQKHLLIGDPSLTVSCNTCHQGQPHPGN